jgi:hypothetical protein
VKALKTIAALIFVATLAIVLVQPVLDAGDEPSRAAGDRAGGPPADPTGENGPEDAGDELVLARRLPQRCLRPAPPSSSHYVAARRGPRVLIGSPAAQPVTMAEVDGDVAWSPSGRFLAEDGGRVIDRGGTLRSRLFFRPAKWGWSPVADCAVAVTERGNLTFGIPGTNRIGIRMLNLPVADFDFSPNGRRLALVLEGDEQGLWVMDLPTGAMTRATEGVPHLMGWFSNRTVVFTRSRSEGRMRYATGSGRVRVVPDAFAGGTLERCGGRAFVMSLRSEATPALAELVSRRGRLRQRDISRVPIRYAGFSGAACSPDGAFLAAASRERSGEKGPLLLLRSDGTFVRVLVPGRTADPEWSSEGLLFAKFGNVGRGRLWFVPPGGALRRTAYRVGGPGQYDWHVAD